MFGPTATQRLSGIPGVFRSASGSFFNFIQLNSYTLILFALYLDDLATASRPASTSRLRGPRKFKASTLRGLSTTSTGTASAYTSTRGTQQLYMDFISHLVPYFISGFFLTIGSQYFPELSPFSTSKWLSRREFGGGCSNLVFLATLHNLALPPTSRPE